MQQVIERKWTHYNCFQAKGNNPYKSVFYTEFVNYYSLRSEIVLRHGVDSDLQDIRCTLLVPPEVGNSQMDMVLVVNYLADTCDQLYTCYQQAAPQCY